MDISKFFDSIDYPALQDQKLHLLNLTATGHDNPTMWAVIHMIDALQDSAVESGYVSESAAFNI